MVRLPTCTPAILAFFIRNKKQYNQRKAIATMPDITLPVQKADKVIKPPVKSLQLGDGYEQTFQNAIADVEEWKVTTPAIDD